MHLQFVWFVKESGRSLSKKKKVEGKMGKERKIVETDDFFVVWQCTNNIYTNKIFYNYYPRLKIELTGILLAWCSS